MGQNMERQADKVGQMRKGVFFFLIFLSSCSRYAALNEPAFKSILPETPIATIEARYGKPVEISHENGEKIYTYVERIYVGSDLVEEIRYSFLVKEGKVVSKEIERRQIRRTSSF